MNVSEWLIYILLGLIQGLTEILPISSSGHLLLLQEWIGLTNQDFGLEVFLHFGSLIAVVFFFRKRLLALILGTINYVLGKDRPQSRKAFRLSLYLVLATIPAGLFGILFEDWVSTIFIDVVYVGFALYITAGLLLYSASKKGTRSIDEMTWFDALAIGLFQVLGVLPGVSRSGSTLSGGLIRNFKQSEAAEFAFLLFIPIATGVTLLKVPDYLATLSLDNLGPQIAGLMMSILATYVALSFLLALIRRGKIHYFAYYCLLMGSAVLVYSFFQ